MSDFQELIKNFDRIRDYMRQFYVYGFKVRSEFDAKSSRTYDNERRRIESWLSGYTASSYTAKGKQVYINVDSKTISQNPLYAAWKSKSFTDNDILLHFFLLDILMDRPYGMTAGALGDEMSTAYGIVFDTQTVRLKLKEYEALGILSSVKEGKHLAYSLRKPLALEQTDNASPLWNHLIDAVKFFQESAPFGFIGSTILDRENASNDLFQFKHHFIVHTLEDGILLKALEAIRNRQLIRFENKSRRTGNTSCMEAVPLKIFVSTNTGRRYLCLYRPEKRRFHNARLDSIISVTMIGDFEHYDEILRNLEKNKEKCWGVSFGGDSSRIETIYIKLFINEKTEAYIIDRLYREGRGGEVMRIRENEYLYSGSFFDTNEMLSWVKTFTGRILDIQGSNPFAIAKLVHDLDTMYRMYCGSEDHHGTI